MNNIDEQKFQLIKWIEKIKRNIIIYKTSYSTLSKTEKVNLIRRQYHLLLLIKKVLKGKGQFQGFDKVIQQVGIDEVK